MGIRTTFDGNAQVIDISSIADDMLAQVIADHAAQRFRAANIANRQISGGDVTYTVTVDGKTVHRGKGDIFPTNQVSTILRSGPPARLRRTTIVVDWLWHQLQGMTLSKAITAIGQIDDAITFARVLINPRGEAESLFAFLWRLYLQRHVSPSTARFISKAWERSHHARAAFRFYRKLRLAGSVLSRPEADPDVLAWIARELRDRSPVHSGAYRDAHMLYADQRPLMAASDLTDETDLPDAREFSFTNAVPYSRKIEFGKTQSGRDFVIQVPNRIYERLAEDARNRFRGVADIRFEMRGIVGAQINQGKAFSWRPRREATGTIEKGIKPGSHNKPGVRFPSIVVTF